MLRAPQGRGGGQQRLASISRTGLNGQVTRGKLPQRYSLIQSERDSTGRCDVLLAASSSATSSFRTALADTFSWKSVDVRIWGLVLPQLASNLLDPIMSLCDAAIVGRLGTQQLAGVGFASIGTFIMALFSFLSLLTTTAVAEAFGQGDFEQISRTSSAALQIAILLGLATTVMVWLGSDLLVKVVKPDPQVAIYGVNYMKAKSWANPATLALYVLGGTFRGVQDTKATLYAYMVGNVANVLMDVLFIFGFGWGVTGAALATAVSQVLSFVLLMNMATRRGVLKPEHLLQRPSGSQWKKVGSDGLFLQARSLSMIAILILTNASASRLGYVAQAGFEILRQVFIFMFVSYESFNGAVQSLVAAELGRRDWAAASATFQRCLQYALLTATVLAAIIFPLRALVARMFTQDPLVIAAVSTTIPVLLFLLPLDALSLICDGLLLAGKQQRYMALASIAGVTVASTLLFTFQSLAVMSLLTVWLSLRGMAVTRASLVAHRVFVSDRSPLAPYWRRGSYEGVAVEKLPQGAHAKLQ